MAPRKKSGRGRKVMKKKADGGGADYMPVEEMSREQLELFVQRLHEERKREREERQLFKIERDKIKSFWEICLDQLQYCKDELRRKDYEIIETEGKKLRKLNRYKQKVKLLLCGHQNAFADLKAEGVIHVELAEYRYIKDNLLLVADNKHIQRELLEQELTSREQVKNLQMQHRQEVSDKHAEFLLEVRDMYSRFEKKSEAVRRDVTLSHSSELAKLEEQKECKIYSLVEKQEKSLSNMKHYHDDIILSNLNSISSLKEELIYAQSQEKLMRKQLKNAVAQHCKLAEPLKVATAEVDALKKAMACNEGARTSLVNSKARLMKCEKAIENLKYANDILLLQVEEEKRDGLQKGFMLVTLDIQQKSSLKIVLLQSKLSVLVELLRQKDAQVVEVLAASRKSAGTTYVMEQKIEEILKAKNTVIQDLQYELSRASKSRDDLVQTYWTKLQEYGIATEELDLVPLEVTAKGLKKEHGAP